MNSKSSSKKFRRKWRRVIKGIKIYLVNVKMKNVKLIILKLFKDLKFDASENNRSMECPMCGCKSKVRNIGFYNYYYNFYGINMMKKKMNQKNLGVIFLIFLIHLFVKIIWLRLKIIIIKFLKLKLR